MIDRSRLSGDPVLFSPASRRWRTSTLALAFSLAAGLGAQSPQLAVEFNTVPRPLGSFPDTEAPGAVLSGRYTYFRATTPAAGTELWRTDGTTANTAMVRDLLPGPSSGVPRPPNTYPELVPFRLRGVDGVLFRGVTEGEGAELWFSDGTNAGTRRVADIEPGPGFSDPGSFLELGGLVYFAATDSVAGRELWVTDGTSAGTRRVADVEPGPGSSDPTDLAASPIAGELVFAAATSAAGREVFRSGGTAASTVLLADLEPGAQGSAPWQFRRVGARLVFQASTIATGRELFATDGTAAATVLLADIAAGPDSSTPQLYDGAARGGRIYFAAGDSRGTELWSTNGLPGGTSLVSDIEPGPASSHPTGLVDVGGTLVFSAWTTASGNEPHALVANSVVRLADLNPGQAGSDPRWITPVGTGFVAAITEASGAIRLWGSAPVPMALASGTPGSPPVRLPNGDVLLAMDDAAGVEPWVTDGTVSGTRLLVDLAPGMGSGGSGIRQIEATVGDRLFVALDEPWTYAPGTGAVSLGDLNPGPLASFPTLIASTPDFALMSSDSASTGLEPFVFGPSGPARLLADLVPGPAGSVPFGPGAVLGDLIVFAADVGAGHEPWVTDGTTAGTLSLGDLSPGPLSSLLTPSAAPQFTAFEGRVYFVAAAPASGIELWSTDGTPGGTALVADIDIGPSSSNPEIHGAFLGRLWFSATYPGRGRELWSTDGTITGTRPEMDLEPGPASSDPESFTVVAGGRAVFSARSAAFGRELYVTDGTPSGTVRLTDVAPGPASATFPHVVAAEDRAFFSVARSATRFELWVSDLTPGGTRAVGVPIEVSGQFDALRPVGTRVHVVGASAARGFGFWESDGTAAGTIWIGPRALGVEFQSAILDGVVYATIDDPVVGVELFRIDDAGAIVEDLGDRCGPTWSEIESTAPTLGSTLTVTVRNAPAQHLGLAVLADANAPRTAQVGLLAPGCYSHVLPALDLFGLGTAATWQAQLAVPNTPALSGLGFHVQAAFAPLAGGLLSSSNALRLTIGR